MYAYIYIYRGRRESLNHSKQKHFSFWTKRGQYKVRGQLLQQSTTTANFISISGWWFGTLFIFPYMVQRSNPLPPPRLWSWVSHSTVPPPPLWCGGGVVVSPSPPCGVVGVWYCAYVYTYIYIYIYIYCAYVYVYIYICMCVCVYIHTYVYIYICIYIYTYVYVYIYIWYMCVYMYLNVSIYIYILINPCNAYNINQDSGAWVLILGVSGC